MFGGLELTLDELLCKAFVGLGFVVVCKGFTVPFELLLGVLRTVVGKLFTVEMLCSGTAERDLGRADTSNWQDSHSNWADTTTMF